jgi:hypothetical protein
MSTHYIPEENARLALVASLAHDTFFRRAAIAQNRQMGWAHKLIPTEAHKRPGAVKHKKPDSTEE